MPGQLHGHELERVDENIWVVDGPAVSFYGLPYPTRMVVIRLASGELFLHSPIEMTDPLRTTVDALGPVRHLVSPNKIHHLFVGRWADAYPDAKTWASPGLRQKSRISWDHDLNDEAPEAWRDEIEQLVFRGSMVMEEVLFFHRASRTVMLADLIENFDPATLSTSLRIGAKVVGILHPNGQAPIDYRLSFLDRNAARESFAQVLAWKPERVILAHGIWAREDGEAFLRHHFRWLGAGEGGVK